MGVQNKINNKIPKHYKVLSKFYNLHPIVNFLYLSGVLVIIFSFNHPVFQLTNFIIIFSLAVFYCGLEKIWSMKTLLFLIAIFTFILNPLFVHRGETALFYFMDNPITLQAVFYGFNVMLTILSMILVFTYMNKILDSNKFLYLFSKFIPQTTFILNMTIRFSSLIVDRAKLITSTLKTRGLALESSGFKQKIANNSKIMESLFIWTLEDGLSVSEGLKSKNYGKYRRTFYNKYAMKSADIIYLCGEIILLIVIVYFAYKGVGKFNFYPNFPSLALSYKESILYAISVIFMLVPVISELIFNIMRNLQNGYNKF